MQEVKIFVHGALEDGRLEMKPIDTQINEFLKSHPNHYAKSISTMVTNKNWTAFVIFDVREQKEERKNQRTKEGNKS